MTGVPRRVPRNPAGSAMRERVLPEAATRSWIWWAAPLIGLAIWVATIATMHPGDLGPWGLLPEFPFAYWVAVAGVLLSGVLLSQRRRLQHAALLAHAVVLTLLLYAIAPAIEAVPRYTYTYKHIGITEYIERYGSVDTNIDIYHRWPGFFSLSALFSKVAGLPDPTSYAAWAEPFFATLDGLLVWCCVQALTRSARHAWLAALLFTACNWIGQNYYSPQAFGYVLMLGVLLLVLVSLQGPPNRLGSWVERRFRGLFRVTAATREEAPFPRSGSPLRVAGLVLLLDAVLVASHQLTPYILLLQLGGLMLAGYLRPWWLAIAAGLVTIGYLIPNLSYVVNTFGLFNAPDPLANATQKNVDGTPILEGRIVMYVGALSFISVFLLALIGVIRRARLGYIRSAVVLAMLAFASPGLLAGQSYGGEARLRVLLYALPWGCAGACWAMSPDNARRVGARVWAPVANAAWFVLAFVIVFFGHEDLQLLTPGEVGAAAALSDPSKVAPESVVVLLDPNFPARYGALYFRAGSELPALSYDQFGQTHALLFPDQGDVDFVADKILADSGTHNGYLVFSRGQETWARDYQLYPPYALRAFEGEVARSKRFRIVYDTPTARIYQLVR
ncbi:MAG: hypothetical protein QOD70_1613 [Frankiales bacterium]|nr:hypothetical protein [Frankiales bacterium]